MRMKLKQKKKKNTCDKKLTTTYTWSVTIQCRACLHEGGGLQVGEVTCDGLPHLSCKCDHIKRRDCMDRRVTPPKRVTSPTWGPPPPCKQALSQTGYYVQGSYLQVFTFSELKNSHYQNEAKCQTFPVKTIFA